jgi:predicted RNA-binding Zn ribbon-like protein
MQVSDVLAFVNGDGSDFRELRDACRVVFTAHVEGRATLSALAPLNRLIDQHLTAQYVLVAAHGRVGSARISTGQFSTALLLSDICLAIVELFAGAKAARIKQCASPTCERFFLDESKSGTRTWCDMKTCGNRMKAARYYERKAASR